MFSLWCTTDCKSRTMLFAQTSIFFLFSRLFLLTSFSYFLNSLFIMLFLTFFFFCMYYLSQTIYKIKKEPQIQYIQIIILFMSLSVLAALFSPGYLYCQILRILLYSRQEPCSSLDCNSSRIIIINSYVLSLFCSYLTQLLPE